MKIDDRITFEYKFQFLANRADYLICENKKSVLTDFRHYNSTEIKKIIHYVYNI